MSRAVDAAIALTKMADSIVPGIRHDFGMVALDYLDANVADAEAIVAYAATTEPVGLEERLARAVIDVCNEQHLAIYQTERGAEWFDRRRFASLVAARL